MIEIKNVSKRYGQKVALSNVDLSLKPGKIIGLLGPNGSGKTTLIKILNGLLRDYEGEVTIEGHPINEITKGLVSYLPDRNYLPNWTNAEGAIKIFKDLYSDFDELKMRSLLEKLNLNPKEPLKTMSKGMKEKFQLALVMSRNAKIYILDEPIGGVDPAARELILKTILENYAQDSMVLISTHLIADIEQIFDSVIFLKEGEVVLNDDVDTIRQTHGMSIEAYFKEVFRC
ncbi:MAG: ABC-2 type transport system ATP-binding protein [Erysipelotrichaceae bacterium]|nr:MAG: ABC-2 type transport system ATP-binding [Erysipelotrichaceae bacterium]TXT19652.1 MAG: ABC-2 type transport system ATP-binding protein [Erysipelotrichaceae bacterium]